MTINSFKGEYSFLSNFYESLVTYDGLTYQNSEAAFQAQKCQSLHERIPFTRMNPSEAKKAGRKVILRKDWEQVKINIMAQIVKAKFEQNEELAVKLLNTGDAYLEEGNDWGDRIWGTVNGQGSNYLGYILMAVRDHLNQKIEKENHV